MTQTPKVCRGTNQRPITPPPKNQPRRTTAKVQPFPRDRALGHPYLKEEITPGGIHPEWGHNPNKQAGSKEGREEGDGAEEEAFRL